MNKRQAKRQVALGWIADWRSNMPNSEWVFEFETHLSPEECQLVGEGMLARLERGLRRAATREAAAKDKENE